MRVHYKDIIERIGQVPLWFDEHAVPRYEPFSFERIANVYAEEAVLLRIECQNCGRLFDVCMSVSHWQSALDTLFYKKPLPSLAEQIKTRTIHYGDPPNTGCCGIGCVMNSIPRRVLEYWIRESGTKVSRNPELEVDVTPDWVNEQETK